MGIILKKPWVDGLHKLERFTYLEESYKVGFQNYVRLNILEPIESQLELRELVIRKHIETKGDVKAIRSFVEKNSSLKIDFGFSFTTFAAYKQMMRECIAEVAPKYNVATGTLIGDADCNWFGFQPLNIFEQAAIEDLDIDSLILYNNELIRFQVDVVTFVANHPFYKQHSLALNDTYRFKYFKALRRDEGIICSAFWEYMDAFVTVRGVSGIHRDRLEKEIGCHFLYYPDKFFEMMEFLKLKGELYE